MIAMSMPHRSPRASDDPRWNAVLDRQTAADGTFVYAVRTTGVFCRPSCPSRRPKRENVQFFAEPEGARRAGYRACRRCHPEGQAKPTVDPIETAWQAIQADPAAASLASLARRVGLSAGHLQRRFKARYGVSPRELAAQGRSLRLRRALRGHHSVSRATYEAGYGSSSRVYQAADAILGMTPADYARGGLGQVIRYTTVSSAFGPLLVAVTERGVSAVLLGRDDTELIQQLTDEFPRAELERVDAGRDDYLRKIVGQVVAQTTGVDREGKPLPLDLVGTEFQIRVWKALLTIPRGETSSYRAIAEAIGRPKSVRAVANAIGTNRLAIVVPCHRVIRHDGSLGGYRWGLPLKRRLMAAEQSARS